LLIGIRKIILILIAILITYLVIGTVIILFSTPFITAMYHYVSNHHEIVYSKILIANIPLLILIDIIVISIPYLFLAVLLILYIPLIVVDNLGIGSAFHRSWSLVWGNWWRTAIILGIANLIVPLLFPWLELQFAHFLTFCHIIITNTWFYHGIVQGVVSLFYVPFYCSLLLVQLHDLKIRNGYKSQATVEEIPSP